MNLAHKIELKPTKEQEHQLRCACGHDASTGSGKELANNMVETRIIS